eukprot:TRINITY_DN2544_c0_g1_i1.p1 TRINITY_DN2544_c0_g1~~TRINITY_DN2544_c0_g1_i1.p1  ORF type:complete len:272 (-),score=70.56 TRINITY_DN2544_c0_g1_i1:70-885(-)
MDVEANTDENFQKATNLLNKFKPEFEKKNADLAACRKYLDEAKVLLTSQSFLLPASHGSTDHTLRESLARELLEYGALLSTKEKDPAAFERNITQLRTYYFDVKQNLPPSNRQYPLLGLNLLRLLAQRRLGEFHTELELFSREQLKNVFLDFPIRLEQYLMEGSYNKILQNKDDVPAEYYSYFMGVLMDAVRDQIAGCCESAYEQLSVPAALKMLKLSNQQELAEFSKSKSWSIEGNYVKFRKQEEAKAEVPSMQVMMQTLSYAKELERIV